MGADDTEVVMLPQARSEQLTVQQLADETLVFDHRCGKAHCLNQTSHFIWKHCDGRTSRAELAARVRRDLGLEHPEIIVELALEQLAQRDLLQSAVVRPSPQHRRSRRDLLKKLAAAAVLLPAIMTIAAPKAHAIGSLACRSNADCSSLTGAGGCVTGACQSGRCTLVSATQGTPCSNPLISNNCACDGTGSCNFC
jgi:hypothetical protein